MSDRIDDQAALQQYMANLRRMGAGDENGVEITFRLADELLANAPQPGRPKKPPVDLTAKGKLVSQRAYSQLRFIPIGRDGRKLTKPYVLLARSGAAVCWYRTKEHALAGELKYEGLVKRGEARIL